MEKNHKELDLKGVLSLFKGTNIRSARLTEKESSEQFQPDRRDIKNSIGLDKNPLTFGVRNDSFVKAVAKQAFDNKEHIVVMGAVQSGKTKMMTQVGLYGISHYGMSSNIIVNNYQIDKESFIARLTRLIGNYSDQLCLKPGVRPFAVTMALLKRLVDPDSLKEGPKIRPTLCNNTQLKKCFLTCDEEDFITIADESDLTAVNEKDAPRNMRGKIIEEMILHPNCAGSIRVSATIQAHLTVDDTVPVKCGNIFVMPDNDCHVSYGSDKFKLVATENDFHLSKSCRYSPSQKRELFKLISFRSDYVRVMGHVPVFLFMLTRTIKEQEYIKDLLNNKYGMEAVFVVVNNGKIRVDHPGESDFNYKLDKSMTLQDILREISETDMTGKMVMIIGDAMLGRGQSPRSEIDNFISFKDIIFAQTSFVACSTTTCVDNLLQKTLRIGGIFPEWERNDFPPLHVYTSQNIINNVDIIMDWNRECIKMIKNPENADKLARDILPPIEPRLYFNPQDPKDKLRKVSRKAPRVVKKGDQVYLTSESYENRADLGSEGAGGNPLLREGTISRKIIDILTETGQWMSSKEIYKYKPVEFWNLNTNTPVSSIGTEGFLLCKAKLIKRNIKNGVYHYKIKN